MHFKNVTREKQNSLWDTEKLKKKLFNLLGAIQNA